MHQASFFFFSFHLLALCTLCLALQAGVIYMHQVIHVVRLVQVDPLPSVSPLIKPATPLPPSSQQSP